MWWKRLKRRRRFARKRNLTYLLFLFILLSMGIGYAVLNTTLGIDGTSQLANAKWDIHFDNIQVKEGSVTPTSAATITDDTTVSFSVTLENPGDFYEFNVDVVNAGTINAMIDTISIQPVLTENQQKYLDYIVTYSDGTELAENQRLDAGDSETLRIAFIYKEADDPDDYPDEDEDIPVEVSIIYVQENDDAEDVSHPPTLYGVLKDAAKEGTYAKEYTGAHKDSFTQNPSKKIYHWYADNDTEGTAILDKNNVIFAGQCWQMIRTTDTGGVKMIYNGEAENNQCLSTRGTHVGYDSLNTSSQNLANNYWYGTDYIYDPVNNVFKLSGTTEQVIWNETTYQGLIGKYTCKSTSVDGTCSTLYLVESKYDFDTTRGYLISLNSNSHYSQFGKLQFNGSACLPAYVGYMYNNNNYVDFNKNISLSESVLLSSSLSTSYWYADSITWGNPTSNNYNLDNPYKVNSSNDYPNLVEKYTFRNTSQTYTNSSVNYIVGVNKAIMYYIQLDNSDTHTLADYNYTYTFGNSYTDNGNGTYTIENATTINRSDWYTNYSNIGVGKYVCKNAVNDTCNDLWYTTSTSNTTMKYIKVKSVYKFSKGFTWDGSKYILDDENSVSFWNINDSTNKTSINNAHYTCWNETGECTTISYIYYIGDSDYNYIENKNGKGVEDALNDMLYNNAKNSTIKLGVESWYRHFIFDNYDNYIEDTIFCNDRSQKSANTNGWNPNGGNITKYLEFKENNKGTSDLSCTNMTDQFSVSNNDAHLTYKVGLMSSPEMNILNNDNARRTGQYYWLISPDRFATGCTANLRNMRETGGNFSAFVMHSYGVRPAISLKPGTTYSTGDGSMANPYMVDDLNLA